MRAETVRELIGRARVDLMVVDNLINEMESLVEPMFDDEAVSASLRSRAEGTAERAWQLRVKLEEKK